VVEDLIPFTRVVKLRYATQINLASASSSTVRLHTFSGNNLYDPDVSGIGHQPLGHDQMAALYEYYRVRGSKIRCKVLNYRGASGEASSILALAAVQQLWTTSDEMSAIVEEGDVVYKMLTSGGGSEGLTPNTFEMYRPTKQFLPWMMDDFEMWVATGDAPSASTAWYWQILVQNSLSNVSPTTPPNYDIMVEIEYFVEYAIPKVLPQS